MAAHSHTLPMRGPQTQELPPAHGNGLLQSVPLSMEGGTVTKLGMKATRRYILRRSSEFPRLLSPEGHSKVPCAWGLRAMLPAGTTPAATATRGVTAHHVSRESSTLLHLMSSLPGTLSGASPFCHRVGFPLPSPRVGASAGAGDLKRSVWEHRSGQAPREQLQEAPSRRPPQHGLPAPPHSHRARTSEQLLDTDSIGRWLTLAAADPRSGRTKVNHRDRMALMRVI